MMRTIDDTDMRVLLRRGRGRAGVEGSVGSMMGMSALLLALGACSGGSGGLTDPDLKTDPTLAFTGVDATKSLEEGSLDAGTYVATLKGSTGSVTYSVSGADASLFTIDATTGVLSFKSVPDYEALTLSEQTDGLSVTVTANSGSLTVQHTVRVHVTNVDLMLDAESLMGGSLASVVLSADENVAFKHDFKVTGGEGVKFSLGGDDAGLFSVEEATGEVSFGGVFDYEESTDEGKDNGYTFSIVATHKSGETLEVKRVTVRVSDVNEAPAFGLDEKSTLQVLEGETVVGTYVASDEDAGDSVTYSLGGGDAVLFKIDANTGALSFKVVPTYDETDGASNVHEVTIVATDNDGLTAEHELSVEVVEDAGAIVFLNVDSEESVQENTQAVGVFAVSGASAAVTYTLSGADAVLFAIAGDGKLSFKSAPDYESLTAEEKTNGLSVTITATSGGSSVEHDLKVLVTDANDDPLWDSETETVSVAENTLAVSYVATASDGDGDTLTYGLSGVDGDKFSIDADTGVLSFKSGANFEAKGSVAGSNDYRVTVTASDGRGGTDTHAVSVSVTDVDEAPKFDAGESSTLQVLEGETVAGTYAASDEDAADSVTYSLGGVDADKFDIDGAGALSFKDAGGVVEGTSYDVTIVAKSTGVSGTEQTAEHEVVLEVVDKGEGIAFLNVDSEKGVEENSTEVGTYVAKAVLGAAVTYSLSGADAALFAIDTDGKLSFIEAPNYEESTDVGGDNEYDVTVTATSGGSGVEHDLKVLVSDVDEAPIFDGGVEDRVAVVENSVSVAGIFTAVDAEGESVEYTIKEEGEGVLFTIDGNGMLSFLRAPDFESLTASQQRDGLRVTIEAKDSGGLIAEHELVVEVTNVNEAPVWSSVETETVSVAENQTAVSYVATASDEDGGDVLRYSLGGTDAGKFDINTATGVLTFKTPPDFEKLTAEEKTNGLSVTVVVTDGGDFTDTHELTVKVTNVNETPRFDGSPSASVSVGENSQAVGTYTASDPDGDALTYSVSGTDAGLFTIDGATGELTFKTPPNYEALTAEEKANGLSVTVVASDDGGLKGEHELTVRVTNVDEGPLAFEGSPSASVSVAENTREVVGTYTASDPDGGAVTYSVRGTVFTIDANTGELTFKTPPNYETLTEAQQREGLSVTITATTGTGAAVQTAEHALTVTVTDVDEGGLFRFDAGSSSTLSVDENVVEVETFSVVGEGSGDAVFTLSGADEALFAIDGDGKLSFKAAPDFEALTASQKTNGFSVTITATTGTGGDEKTVSHVLALTVTDVNEAPVWSSVETETVSVAENQTAVSYVATASDEDAGDVLRYSLGGTDAGKFDINTATGVLTFKTPPDFEKLTAEEKANGLSVTVVASDDGGLKGEHKLKVKVTDVNEAPIFAAGLVTSVTFAENTGKDVTIFTAMASDEDAGDSVTYSLGGTDAVLFEIDETSGKLTFKTPPDYETLTPSEKTNGLSVTITATGGTGVDEKTDTHELKVKVTDVNETPIFSAGLMTSVEVMENSTGAGTFAASDGDGDVLMYALSGDDAALFEINGAGVLTFKSGPDFEVKGSADGDNGYEVTITADDGKGGMDTHELMVNVTDVNEAPVFADGLATTVSVGENTQAVATVTATDEDAGDSVMYSVTGMDAALFEINGAGALSFKSAPDFESLTAEEKTNGLSVTVVATDDDGLKAEHELTVKVTNVEEGPLAFEGTPSASVSVAENTQAVGTYTASDPDGGAVTYSVGGAVFTIDANTGELTFKTPPDYESLTAEEKANGLSVTITATTGTGAAVQTVSHALTVKVTDVVENRAPIFSAGLMTSVTVKEDSTTLVGTFVASDPDGDALMYVLSGVDSGLFVIDAATGELNFKSVPDHESLTAEERANGFSVTIEATDDGGLTAEHELMVSVEDFDLMFTNGAGIDKWNSVRVMEGTDRFVFDFNVDADDKDVVYRVYSTNKRPGYPDLTDATPFEISSEGVLSFKADPDFENPAPSTTENDNYYLFYVVAKYKNEADLRTIASVTVTNEPWDAVVENYGKKSGYDSKISDLIIVDLGSSGWNPLLVVDDPRSWIKIASGGSTYTGNAAVDNNFINGDKLYIYTDPGILKKGSATLTIKKAALTKSGGVNEPADKVIVFTVGDAINQDGVPAPVSVSLSYTEVVPGYSLFSGVHVQFNRALHADIDKSKITVHVEFKTTSGSSFRVDSSQRTYKLAVDVDSVNGVAPYVEGIFVTLPIAAQFLTNPPDFYQSRVRVEFKAGAVKNGAGGNTAVFTDWEVVPTSAPSIEDDVIDLGLSVGDRDDDEGVDLVGLSAYDDFSF